MKRKAKLSDSETGLSAEVNGLSYTLIRYNEVDADGDMFVPGSIRMVDPEIPIKGFDSESIVKQIASSFQVDISKLI